MKTINNQIICTPFKKAHNEPVQKGKVLMNKTGTSLEALTVLVDAHVVNGEFEADIKKGQKVFVRADRYVSSWGKEKVTCPALVEEKKTETGETVYIAQEGKEPEVVKEPVEFIVVPFSEVVMVD
jgi:hypothetical protein